MKSIVFSEVFDLILTVFDTVVILLLLLLLDYYYWRVPLSTVLYVISKNLLYLARK